MFGYSWLEKLNLTTKRYEPGFPLRAVGLAYELGHKQVLRTGALRLAWAALCEFLALA